MPKIKLPQTPSKLLRVALNDLIKTEKSNKYEIDMGSYHSGDDKAMGEPCSVCLAGSVMAQTLKAPIHKYRSPTYYDGETYGALLALNQFRVGNIESGFDYLGIWTTKDKEVAFDLCRRMPRYGGKGIRFKNAIRKLIADLKKAGY